GKQPDYKAQFRRARFNKLFVRFILFIEKKVGNLLGL
ncbi:MAG: hypothetical protein RIR36_634, partial [Bacteroidota bacterium]